MKSIFLIVAILVSSALSLTPLPLHAARPTPAKWEALDTSLPQATEQFKVRMGLVRRNMDVVKKTLDIVSDPREPTYGEYFTAEQIHTLVSPEPSHVAAVRQFLLQNNIGSHEFSPMQDSVSFMASIPLIEEMFSVKFAVYKHRVTGQRVSRALGQVHLPKHLHHAVDLVAGFRGFPVAMPLLKKSEVRSVKSSDDNITPQKIFSTYNITTFPTPSPSNIQAFFQAQAQYVDPQDLTQFCAKYFPSGGTNCSIAKYIGTNNGGKAGDESSLDSQYIIGVNEAAVQTWVYSYPNFDFCADLAQWGQDVLGENGTSHPYVISMSYGTQDLPNQCAGADVPKLEQDVLLMTSMGISVIIASGDDGSGYDLFYLNPSWPASIPYATAVGSTTYIQGTTLEAATTEFGSGGGFSFDYNDSTTFPWQASAVAGYFQSGVAMPNTTYSKGGRGTPDVAALGQDFNIVDGGRFEKVSGTSASTPTFASIVSMLNNERMKAGGRTLGFLNPFLYQNAQAFRDVTQGDNKQPFSFLGQGWECAKGWDPVTGLGTPNFPALLQAVQELNAKQQKKV